MAEKTLASEKVLVVNFGSQYAHLIARRVREIGVYSEIVDPAELSPKLIEEVKPRAVILSGGPSSVYEEDSPRIGEWILGLGIPVLGICYGHQLLAKLAGGSVKRGRGEYGATTIELTTKDPLFEGFEEEEIVWMSHADYVENIPASRAMVLAKSRDTGYVAAFRLRDKPIYGVQFHPEVVHTPKGMKLFENFLQSIAGLEPTWRVEDLVGRIVSELKTTIGSRDKVLVAVSGGVDSTTVALLLKRAIGDRLVAVFVNHGFMREGEVDEVLSMFRKLGINVHYVNAEREFKEAIKNVRDCEEKRRIIGAKFAEIFKKIAESDPMIKWLAQGTTYPDVIESGKPRGADRIKSHHNVAALPEWLGLKVVEPIKMLYKDEVRRLAVALGVPREIAYRHPFPGPGLAVRIIGEVTDEKLRIARKASRIVEEELKNNSIYQRVWQAFAVVGDDKWVGVKGDKRVEGYIVTIRIVESEDGMTADWSRVPPEVLNRIAWRITSEIPEVSMVTYSITTKPPSTIEPC